MSDRRVSLCITYPNRNYPDRLILFRVADYYEDVDRMHPIPFGEEDCDDSLKIIGAPPRDLYSTMAVLREWEYESDDSDKTLSFRYSDDVYEIVFPQELEEIDYSDADARRKVLCTGFTLDEHVSNKLLIAVGKSGSHNAFLFCHKSDLKKLGNSKYAISTDVRDMLHSLHSLEEYDIVDDDIIDTYFCNISLPDGYKAPMRYFYNRTHLPSSVGTFHPIDFANYIPGFISSYLKKNKSVLQFSTGDIRKIADMMESVLDDHDFISDFFRITGYTQERLEELLPQYKEIIISAILADSSVDLLLQRCILQDPSAYERCVEIVKSKWLAEQNDERDAILRSIAELKEQQVEIDTEIRRKIVEQEHLAASIDTLSADIQAKTEEYGNIKADIAAELQAFSDNVVHSTALCAVVKAAGGVSTSSAPIDILKISPQADKNDDTLDHDDFQESLADNFVVVGYTESVADPMAQLVTFGIASKMPILLSGNEDNIAKCVAAMFGYSVFVLNIGTNMTSKDYVTALKTQIGDEPSKNAVILVNGSFSGFSAEHFNALKYNFSDEGNIVLFSLDGVEPGIIPKSIFEKSVYLECGYDFTYKTPSNLEGYSTSPSDLYRDYTEAEVQTELVKLEWLIHNGLIPSTQAVLYAKYMADINCNIKKDWLLLLQIMLYSKAVNKQELFQEWLKNSNIDLEILNLYM